MWLLMSKKHKLIITLKAHTVYRNVFPDVPTGETEKTVDSIQIILLTTISPFFTHIVNKNPSNFVIICHKI